MRSIESSTPARDAINVARLQQKPLKAGTLEAETLEAEILAVETLAAERPRGVMFGYGVNLSPPSRPASIRIKARGAGHIRPGMEGKVAAESTLTVRVDADTAGTAAVLARTEQMTSRGGQEHQTLRSPKHHGPRPQSIQNDTDLEIKGNLSRK